MEKIFQVKDVQYKIGFIAKEDMYTLYPLIESLNEGITHETFKERLEEMLMKEYNCIGVWHNNELVACCGFWILVKFYNGRHVEPDNVGVLPAYRSAGLGKVMMDYLHDFAEQIGCTCSELNAYVTNERAHKFYFKDGYKILGFHFQKKF
jgi:GNAT superfamily N-acetyltransferase